MLTALLAVLMLTAACFAVKLIYRQMHWSDFCATEMGEEYYRKNCVYVKDKKNIRRLPHGEVRDEGYEACGVCLPGQ